MIQPTTYLFYDLETTGLNPSFDQILQFAAIRTDQDFQELSRHEFRIRLRPDIIPSPGALLATDVSALKALTSGKHEYDAAREIHALLNQPDTISVGYNSLSFDDLFLRFTFYRNLLPVYTHQWQNGCRRLDLFPITVLYWLQDRPLLVWPTVDGRPTLKLEHISKKNGLADGPAHDALVDVAATVELARRLCQDRALWDVCLSLFSKTAVTDFLERLPRLLDWPLGLLIHGKYGYSQNCQIPALYLGQTEMNGSRHLWLRLDKPELRQTTAANIGETTWVIRQKPGQPPFVQQPSPHKLSPERREETLANAAWLKAHPDLLSQIATHHLADSFNNNIAVDVDAALYLNGFPSPQVERQYRQFHEATLPQKMKMTACFNDETTRELAIRLLCRRYDGLAYRFPTYVAYERQIRDEQEPPLDFSGQARLTSKTALTQIEQHRREGLTEREAIILRDLEEYIIYRFCG